MIIILTEIDIKSNSKNKKYAHLDWSDFLIDNSAIARASMVVYMTKDLKVKILKDRHGKLTTSTTIDKVFMELIDNYEGQ